MAVRTKAKGEANGQISITAGDEKLIIPRIQPKLIQLEIVGITPLIVSSWTAKARQQMLDDQMKKAKKPKEARDPDQEYKDSRYISTEGWDGIPAGGLKGCLVNACRATDGAIPMTLAKRMIFIHADGKTEGGQQLVRLYAEPEMHSGMVRLDNGNPMERFRAMYRDWSMKLTVEFLANIISQEQVCNLIELAGYCEGLCEHRPGSPKNNTGDFGRFCIKREE